VVYKRVVWTYCDGGDVMLRTWMDMCLLLIGGCERKRYVSMKCITKVTSGEKHYGVYVVDEGCEWYFDILKGALNEGIIGKQVDGEDTEQSEHNM
jgi:hypothetical protein